METARTLFWVILKLKIMKNMFYILEQLQEESAIGLKKVSLN